MCSRSASHHVLLLWFLVRTLLPLGCEIKIRFRQRALVLHRLALGGKHLLDDDRRVITWLHHAGGVRYPVLGGGISFLLF